MKRALAVDDSATMRNLVKMALESVGFQVDTAENGQVALDLTRKNSYDLIITDINMPVMNGLEFLREFRAVNRTTPVLVLTTETETAKKEEAKRLGATGWIVKPFKPEDLVKVVKRVVR
ncbi:MAG: response regulator [Aquificota bacterium]|nr:response regulator [Aquificota bacterium]